MTPAIAVLCPGAGTYAPAQCARICADHRVAREMLAELSGRVGSFLHEACVEDSFTALRRISLNYPAIVAAGLLATRVVEHELGVPLPAAVVAGYSLGHFTALVLAGALDPFDAIELVTVRARLMEEAAKKRPGAMLLVGGPGAAEIDELLATWPGGAAEIAVGCRNAADSVALSGTVAAIDHVAERLTADGRPGLRLKRISAGVAAHSPLMDEAREAFAAHLRAATITRPRIPILLNSTGEPCADPERITSELMDQLTTPVRWDLCRESLAALDIATVVDVGPGTMMANYSEGLAPAIHLNSAEPLADAVRALRYVIGDREAVR